VNSAKAQRFERFALSPEQAIGPKTWKTWWFQTFGLFSIICGIILPIDFHIFQDGSKTTNQWAIDGISTNITGICSIDI
jgi:hypothetical protein